MIRKQQIIVRERDVERKLVREVKAIGGLCLKLTSPSVDGLPDRLVLLNSGKIGFVELKAPGKKPRVLQVKRMKDLQALGFKVFVVDETSQIGGVIDAIRAT